MAQTLYLTHDEVEHIFEKFSAELQEKWRSRLQEETLKAFETDDELVRLRDATTYDDLPDMRRFGEWVQRKLQGGSDLEDLDAAGFPDAAIPRFLRSIGACGLSAIIEISLQQPDLSDDVFEAIAGLSHIRHAILEHNAALRAAA
jgi:hypothetical protein